MIDGRILPRMSMRGEKSREIFRHRRIGCIWQSEFLKSAAPNRGLFIERHAREKSIDQNAMNLFTREIHLRGATNQP